MSRGHKGRHARALASPWRGSLLGGDVGVAQLLHMVDARHALHHLLVAELLQGLEVEVPKAPVPPPGFIVLPSCKTKRLCHLYVKNVEAVAPHVHLGEKSVTRIPNAKHAVLDLHARAILIQLSQADDGVPQRRDVVDAGEQPMLAVLGDEDYGAGALDLYGGGIPELDGASNVGIELGEELPPAYHVVGGAGVEAPPIDLVAATGPAAEEGVCLGLVEVAAGAARGGSVLACVMNRAGYCSSACATWAWARRGCLRSLAQWPARPQLLQQSSCADLGFFSGGALGTTAGAYVGTPLRPGLGAFA